MEIGQIMKAFVTGSTGLLGSNLVQVLVAQGHTVKALARSADKARKLLPAHNVEIVIGDMEQIDGFTAELAGCDVLFHTAAYFREAFDPGDHWQKLEQINVHGTIRLLEAAEHHGVQKAIYVSSSNVIGQRPDGKPADESTPPDPRALDYNLYARSKVAAEAAIAAFLKTHTLPVVQILPTAILGPQDAAPTSLGQGVIDILNGKIPVIPPGGFEFVDARDVAQAMLNAVELGKSGERYILTEGYHTMGEMVAAIGQAAQIPVPRFTPPYALVITLARITTVFARLTGSKPPLPVLGLQIMHDRAPVSPAKAVRELGATFRPFAETMRDEVQWYQANGYVTSGQGTQQRVQPAKV